MKVTPKITPNKFDTLLRQQQRSWYIFLTKTLILLGIILVSFGTVGLLDGQRLSEGIPDLIGMVGEMLPPDFSRAGKTKCVNPRIDLGCTSGGRPDCRRLSSTQQQ